MPVPPAEAPRNRMLVVALLFLSTLFSACDAHPARDARWSGGGTPSPVSSPSASGPGGTALQGSGPPSAETYRDRLPAFGKAPPARPVTLTVADGGDVPWISRVPTDQPVAFVTIDDGWVKHPEAAELLREAHVPVTLFLTVNAVSDNPAYFKKLQDIGAVIEAHTITHTILSGKSYVFQKDEICGSADQLGALYGRRPTLFRPPGGIEDATTLRAVRDCGMKAAFFWKESVNQGNVWYQEVKAIQPGDVILMHFRAQFVEDFIAALRAIKAAGLTPAQLEDYFP
ncbi:polysaccharide deacetylase family protein [Dactylosporangium sp. NPDC048998]|uniref:polysaccharide deacetylase family protein n=1 Tax=Dactylosporangium sp. NPDC048998 TaxID=3363976 RepID=UPI003724648F